MPKMPHRKLLFVLAWLLVVPAIPGQSQSGTTITLAVPEITAQFVEDSVIAAFEAANPGIDVYLKSVDQFDMPNPDQYSTLEAYHEALVDYFSAADVVLVNEFMSPEVTRAGYTLDLGPLANSDPSLDPDDFYTQLWNSFQWDGGLWALPMSADAVLLFYDPAAFDAARLSYPTANWTLADFENAVRSLTIYNTDNTVAENGVQVLNGMTSVILSLLGESVVDEGASPAEPRFDNPLLADLLTGWAQMDDDGLFTSAGGAVLLSPDSSAPMLTARSAFARISDALAVAPLPGGHATLSVTGAAVSSGTQYPEAAYALAKFLTTSPEVVGLQFGTLPARRSLQGQAASGPGNGNLLGRGRNRNAANNAVTEQAVLDAFENGYSVSDSRFARAIATAYTRMQQNSIDAATALEETRLELLERLAYADGLMVELVVEPPPTPLVLAEGEIALRLGVESPFRAFPDEERWIAAAADFAASDPQVGVVEVQQYNGNLTEIAEQNDCAFLSSNQVPTVDLSLLRSLDPLLSSDPNFNPDDLIGLELVQRDGMTWAYPAVIQPQGMRYNTDLFNQAGVPLPESGTWTLAEFEAALRQIYAVTGEIPFVPRSFGNSHLLMLIAAYGGLPFDTRTSPQVVNFTAPETIDAIRQVLDLAKDGLMAYNGLAETGGGGLRIIVGGPGETPTALYTELFSGRGPGARIVDANGDTSVNPNPLVTFPTGSRAALSYELGAFYISASSLQAEACYRLITHLAGYPELYAGIPAQRSDIDAAAQDSAEAAFYHAFDALMQQPDTVTIPTVFGGGSPVSILQYYWLNRAADRYVLEDADLVVELTTAEQMTREYLSCVDAIPAFSPDLQDFQTYVQQFTDCAVQVDPAAAAVFGG